MAEDRVIKPSDEFQAMKEALEDVPSDGPEIHLESSLADVIAAILPVFLGTGEFNSQDTRLEELKIGTELTVHEQDQETLIEVLQRQVKNPEIKGIKVETIQVEDPEHPNTQIWRLSSPNTVGLYTAIDFRIQVKNDATPDQKVPEKVLGIQLVKKQDIQTLKMAA